MVGMTTFPISPFRARDVQMSDLATPMFPVTAIRLNRSLPEVRRLLGVAGDAAPRVKPVAIRGEALSATVLRERR